MRKTLPFEENLVDTKSLKIGEAILLPGRAENMQPEMMRDVHSRLSECRRCAPHKQALSWRNMQDRHQRTPCRGVGFRQCGKLGP